MGQKSQKNIVGKKIFKVSELTANPLSPPHTVEKPLTMDQRNAADIKTMRDILIEHANKLNRTDEKILALLEDESLKKEFCDFKIWFFTKKFGYVEGAENAWAVGQKPLLELLATKSNDEEKTAVLFHVYHELANSRSSIEETVKDLEKQKPTAKASLRQKHGL